MKIDFSALNDNIKYQKQAFRNLEYVGELETPQVIELFDMLQQIEEVNNDVISKYGEVLDTVTMKPITKKEFYEVL
jgi:hypothetical protein